MFLDPSHLVRAANTTFIAAAESPQCKDINACRTSQSIIYGSFLTMFLCTWTALHLDVPYPPLLTRVGHMMLALVGPEFMFIRACADWINSCGLLGKILDNYPECGWTETHAQFVTMGGFRLVGANRKTFLECVKDGTIDLPKVSKAEVLARSRRDVIAKSFAVIQTTWFVFQCIHRCSQHLLLTQLEITTLGHTLISFFVYFFWWYKPYAVALPIEVPFKERCPETIGRRDNNEIGENPNQHPRIANDDPKRPSESGLPVANKSRDDESLAGKDSEYEPDVEACIHTPSTSPQHSWYTRLGIKTYSVLHQMQFSILGQMALNTVYFIVGGGFGAMHCLAWNSVFTTRVEQYTWQVSSLIVTIIGGGTVVYQINKKEVDYFLIQKLKRTTSCLIIPLLDILLNIYYFSRVSLLVLALLQLRALPYTGYATPSWSTFYPHIG